MASISTGRPWGPIPEMPARHLRSSSGAVGLMAVHSTIHPLPYLAAQGIEYMKRVLLWAIGSSKSSQELLPKWYDLGSPPPGLLFLFLESFRI